MTKTILQCRKSPNFFPIPLLPPRKKKKPKQKSKVSCTASLGTVGETVFTNFVKAAHRQILKQDTNNMPLPERDG